MPWVGEGGGRGGNRREVGVVIKVQPEGLCGERSVAWLCCGGGDKKLADAMKSHGTEHAHSGVHVKPE